MLTALVLAAVLQGPYAPGVPCHGPLIVQPAPTAGQHIIWLRPKFRYPVRYYLPCDYAGYSTSR